MLSVHLCQCFRCERVEILLRPWCCPLKLEEALHIRLEACMSWSAKRQVNSAGVALNLVKARFAHDLEQPRRERRMRARAWDRSTLQEQVSESRSSLLDKTPIAIGESKNPSRSQEPDAFGEDGGPCSRMLRMGEQPASH
jgi:hypothetical protein